MRAVVQRHVDDVTLLRLAARDSDVADQRAVKKHLESCPRCRSGFAAARRLDRSLTKLAETLESDGARDDRGPDAGYFEFVERLFDASEGAEEAAERILRAARVDGADELTAAFRSLDGMPHRGFALLYAAQKADQLVAEDPNKALALARQLSAEAGSLPPAKPNERISIPAPRQVVQAAAALLESTALLQKGESRTARDAVKPARAFFVESGDLGFGAALCDYYEGQAAGFQRDYAFAERLLRRSLEVFSEFGQESLIARVEAALGTLFSNKGAFKSALSHLEIALRTLDAATEPQRVTMVLNNRGTALMRLGRFDEARATFAKALGFGRRHKHASHLFFIRTGLAELDFRRGEYQRALRAFAEIVKESSPVAPQSVMMLSRLYVAECDARLGNLGAMETEIEALRRERQASPFAPSPAIDELFMCLDQGELDADLIAHVREYLQDQENDVKKPYRSARRAARPQS